MKIDDLIVYLQSVRAEHGNIDALHSDNEHGISNAKPGLEKVVDMPNGTMTYKLSVSKEVVENALDDVANPPVVAELEAIYDHAAEHLRWCSKEEFVKSAFENYEHQKDMVAKYNAAPWSVVF